VKIPPTQLVDQSLDLFPEGDPASSPGVAVLGYPGKDGEGVAQPQRGCGQAWPRTPTQRIAFEVKHWRNPVGVARIIAATPKVAEYSNLGLWASTTTWLKPPTALVGFGPNYD
jgi:hypothetical protein